MTEIEISQPVVAEHPTTETTSEVQEPPAIEAPIALEAIAVTVEDEAPEEPKAESSPAKEDTRPRRERRYRRKRSGSRKDGTASTNPPKTFSKASGTEKKERTERAARPTAPRRERQENLTNVITIGMRLNMFHYVRIIKNVLNSDKHESLILQGFRQEGMARLT